MDDLIGGQNFDEVASAAGGPKMIFGAVSVNSVQFELVVRRDRQKLALSTPPGYANAPGLTADVTFEDEAGVVEPDVRERSTDPAALVALAVQHKAIDQRWAPYISLARSLGPGLTFETFNYECTKRGMENVSKL